MSGAGRLPQRRGVCLVVSAPSGAGKSTVVRALLDTELELTASVSVTTREPREGEAEARDYYFRSEADFARMIAAGEMLEHATVFGRTYGTPRQPVLATLEAGRDLILDVDWQGWRQLKTCLPGDVIGVYLLPPSLPALAQRLLGRRTDTPGEVARRMGAARGEILHWAEFDHVLVNNGLPDCVADVRAILRAARCSVPRNLAAGRLASEMVAQVQTS